MKMRTSIVCFPGMVMLIVMLVLVSPGVVSAEAGSSEDDWRVQIRRVLFSPVVDGQTIEHVANLVPDYASLIRVIAESPREVTEQSDTFVLDSYRGLDGISRPYVVYVPSGYDPSGSYPLLVYLHGLVMRKEIMKDPIEYAGRNEITACARERKWFMLFPMGQDGATWFDPIGQDNIQAQIKMVKARYAIDDNRIWLSGFSDGASGTFALAMLRPDTFAAGVALNGHPGVASIDLKVPLYAVNSASMPLHAVSTDLDNLYPAVEMMPIMSVLFDAGSSLQYKIYRGIGHDFDYSAAELPVIVRYLESHNRDPFPTRITWETSRSDFSRRSWLRIDEIDEHEEPATWHKPFTRILINNRVMFGFTHDETFEGTGVRVSSVPVVDPPSLAMTLGLQPGDIILGADSSTFANLDELTAYKETRKRGDSVTVSVLRGDANTLLTGSFPLAEHYELFTIEDSARIRAERFGNRVTITASRLGAVTIFVHPDLFQLDQPVSIVVNGQTWFEGIVKPDIAYALRDFCHRRDAASVYCNEITCRKPSGEEDRVNQE